MVKKTTTQDTNSESPVVSIGLPVFNGDNYIEQAIKSILNQTFSDLELVICDNASTDDTESICRRYAAADDRVNYHRNHKNLGAAANYDLCFKMAKGTFFKWVSHDDMIEPEYVEKTVGALQNNPDAIKCATGIREIDKNQNTNRIYLQKHLHGHQKRASKRFASLLLFHHNCVEFFSLYRRQALVGSQLHGDYVGSDRTLLAEMALRGQTIRIEDPVLIHRVHDTRSVNSTAMERIAWWNPEATMKRRNRCIKSIQFLNYLKAIKRSAPNWVERLLCYKHMIRWILTRRTLKGFMMDLRYFLSP